MQGTTFCLKTASVPAIFYTFRPRGSDVRNTGIRLMGKVKLLKASAGSGKTYQLAYQYVRNVIAEPWQYRHILAVTFTNKATEEMKRRIISEVDVLATGKESAYLVMLSDDLKLRPE